MFESDAGKLAKIELLDSRPRRKGSFLSVPRIEKPGWLQQRKSAIHGLVVKFGKSDWWKIQNEYSAHAQKIGSARGSIFGADRKERGLWEGEWDSIFRHAQSTRFVLSANHICQTCRGSPRIEKVVMLRIDQRSQPLGTRIGSI